MSLAAEEEKVAMKTGKYSELNNNNNNNNQCFFPSGSKSTKYWAKLTRQVVQRKSKTFAMNWNTTYVIGGKTVKWVDVS